MQYGSCPWFFLTISRLALVFTFVVHHPCLSAARITFFQLIHTPPRMSYFPPVWSCSSSCGLRSPEGVATTLVRKSEFGAPRSFFFIIFHRSGYLVWPGSNDSPLQVDIGFIFLDEELRSSSNYISASVSRPWLRLKSSGETKGPRDRHQQSYTPGYSLRHNSPAVRRYFVFLTRMKYYQLISASSLVTDLARPGQSMQSGQWTIH
jgi:hypothetical protein